MGDFSGALPKDKWVCPNDRHLALRAKLRTGWSVKTGQLNTYKKPETMKDEEQEIIKTVIKRAETIDTVEQERIGRLMDKLENMKKHVLGNGSDQCILCGDQFGIWGASSLACHDCRKGVCSKCGVDTLSAHKDPLWLCKICSESREFMKKSGAWFFKGVPKYILPEKKNADNKYVAGRDATTTAAATTKQAKAVRGRDFNSWYKGGRGAPQEASDHDLETSSDEEMHKGMRRRKKTDSLDSSESLMSNSSRTNAPVSPSYSALKPNLSNSGYHDTFDANVEDGRADLSDSERSVTSEVSLNSMRQFNRWHANKSRIHPESARENLRGRSMRTSGERTRSSSTKGDDEDDVDQAFNTTAHAQHHHRDSGSDRSIRSDKSSSHGDHNKALIPTIVRESPVDDVFEEKYSPDDIAMYGNIEFSLIYDSINSTLHCTIHRARGLRPMDSNGYSDPYVKLHLLPGASKSNKLRTRTVHKTLNPEFNETLTYHGISTDEILKKTLRLSVLDEDAFGHDFIGETRVPLKKLKPHQTKYFNVYLDKQMPLDRNEEILRNEKNCGKILISLKYCSQKKALLVGLIRCANLPSMDPNGLSDPFIKVQMKPDPLRRKYKTTVRWKNLNPEFNEEFVFDVFFQDLPNKTVEITVWDKDYGRTNDYIGGLQIGITSKGERLRHFLHTIKNPDKRHDRWHHLSSELLSD